MKIDLVGSGGGSSKSGTSEAPNTLRSNTHARVLDILGEGQIGLVNGSKSIFFDGVQLQADDGTMNFNGVAWAMNVGVADQSPLPGFSEIETEATYGAEVKKHIPVTKEITNPLVTSARVTIRIPSLCHQTNSSSGLEGNSVTFRIEARAYGGAWWSPFGDITISGKCTSPYDRSYRFRLPTNSGISYPWEIRVTRLTNDSNDSNDNGVPDDQEDNTDVTNQNQTYLQSITEIVEYALSYPWTACIGLDFDASLFGTSMPTRSYLIERLDGLIPVNYDPVARTYSGIWDGTFKQAPNSNPAWALYDILQSKRFGLGRHLSAAALDAVKWDLYEIGRYCDESVPDGFGGTEPRLAYNGVIQSQRDAYELIQLLSSAFRGMTYWSSGAIRAVMDMPSDPVVLVGPANVIDGNFSYQGTALKSRHTVAHVTWNDPEDRYQAATEVVEHADGIARFGRRVKEIAGVGITSRGQAHRLGLWVLETELNEDQIGTYGAGYDHAYVGAFHPGVVPGDIAALQDPCVANIDASGRLLEGSTASLLLLDRPVTIEAGKTYSISVRLPSGANGVEAVTATPGEVSSFTLATAFAEAPLAGAMWVLTASDVAPRPFRVISVSEVEKHIWEVKALLNDPTKYARIDNGVALTPRTYTKIPISISSPRNISLVESRYMADGVAHSNLLISWSAPETGVASTYHLVIGAPAGDIDLAPMAVTSYQLSGISAGSYSATITAISYDGKVSPAATASLTTQGWGGTAAPHVTALALVGGASATVFTGRDVRLSWATVFPDLVGTPTLANPFYAHNTVTVYDASDMAQLRAATVIGDGWTYSYDLNASDAAAIGRSPVRSLRFEVTVTDIYSRVSAAAVLTVTNPVPATVAPSVMPTFDGAVVSITTPSDPDFVGLVVWASTTHGFTPASGNLVFSGPGTSATLALDAGAVYFLRVAAYDAFGTDGLNISTELQVSSASAIDIDALVPSLAAQFQAVSASADEIRNALLTTEMSRITDRRRTSALVTDVRSAVVASEAATASALDVLRAEFDATTGAVASAVTDLQAEFAGSTANGNVTFTAAADQTGALARYQLWLSAVSAGSPVASAAMTLEVVSVGGVAVSQVKFATDRFFVTGTDGSSLAPFSISGGSVFMDRLQVRHQIILGSGGYGGSILIRD